MTREEICRQVLGILRNHSQLQRTIELQIESEKAALLRDIEDIASRAYPSRSISEIHNSTGGLMDHDGLIVNLVDKIDKRKQTGAARIERLNSELNKIDCVQRLILELDAKSRIVLTALYYPYRTYYAAAQLLEVEVTTITRQRSAALIALFKKAEAAPEFKESS